MPPKTETVVYDAHFTGLTEATSAARPSSATIAWMEARGLGKGQTRFRLRDWGISAASAIGAARFR